MMNPSFKRLIYNIATIGASGSGKSALLNKLVNPAFMNIEGTGRQPANSWIGPSSCR